MLGLKLLESFLTCKTSTTRELPKELRLFCCVNVAGGGQHRGKITQRQGGEKYKKGLLIFL